MTNILVAEDNEDLRLAVERALKRCGFVVVVVPDGLQALKAAAQESFDLALVDIRLPGRDGIDVLRDLKKLSPRTQVILMTAYASVDTAIEALRQEAADYLLKPFSLEELESSVQRVLERFNLVPKKIKDAEDRGSLLMGESLQIQGIRRLIQKIAPTSSPVLIFGESGTGKEIVAQEIHRHSTRRDEAFVAINCVALAEGILESELFGHEKGSFTGAISQKIGLLESAERGTIFLDEIGELSPALQVKLLRFLQEHEIQRVGGTKTIRIDTRIIAATNRNLQEDVAAKRFREDLLYRLNVFDITLPPLRERLEDLPLLVNHFLTALQNRLRLSFRVRTEAMAAMQGYSWPGNIRELENVMERAAILSSDGEIGLRELPQKIVGKPDLQSETLSGPEPSGKNWLKNLEKEMIRRALEDNRWNQARAARQLGMKRSTLQYRMQKYALTPPHQES